MILQHRRADQGRSRRGDSSSLGCGSNGEHVSVVDAKVATYMPACHFGISLDARGPNNTITTEETSSLVAIMEAAAVIRRGQADCMIVAATGGRTNRVRLLQRHEPHYSTAYDQPASACKPFDKRRDGTVPGIGAASIVLESRASAVRRGAPILASIVGWSNAFGAPERAWSGSQSSIARSISESLKRANVTASQIDHINSAASGRVELDAAEAKAIRKTVADVPVVATKGYFGDSGASTGIIELCASLTGLQHQKVPVTLNFSESSEDCPVNVIHGSMKPIDRPYFLKTSYTPHGHATAILLRNELI